MKAAAFILYVAGVVSVVMLLFPPFISLSGTEYAFLLTGPEWAHRMGVALGLAPRLHWAALAVQLGAVWALALGLRRLLARRAPVPGGLLP